MNKTLDEMTLVMRINALTDQIITLQEQQQEQINQLLQACNDAIEWHKQQIKELEKSY